jgi:hypothetical protein
MKTPVLFLLAAFLSMACGDVPAHFGQETAKDVGAAEKIQDEYGDNAVQWDDRFVGLWMVDQPTHGAYEVTFYTFEEGGQLLQTDFQDGWGGRFGETGSVAKAETFDPACTFGDEWHSAGANALVIQGDCTDEVEREIVLELDSDPSNNSEMGGVTIKIVSVGGESDWIHADWPWMFRKCEAEQTEGECMGWYDWAP